MVTESNFEEKDIDALEKTLSIVKKAINEKLTCKSLNDCKECSYTWLCDNYSYDLVNRLERVIETIKIIN